MRRKIRRYDAFVRLWIAKVQCTGRHEEGAEYARLQLSHARSSFSGGILIRLDRRDRVAYIFIERNVARNAMSLAMWHELRALVGEVAATNGIRALVVTGTRDAFVAGADLSDFRAFRDANDGLAYEALVEETLQAIEALPFATVAAIAGSCTGAGVIVACACDVRFGARNAKVGIPIARTVGNVTTAANLARVAAVVGSARVTAWLLGAELDDAELALASGFFYELCDTPEMLAARAAAFAERTARNAPLTIASAKELFRRARANAANVADRDLLERCYGSDDFREGVAAFLAKRPAEFTGR